LTAIAVGPATRPPSLATLEYELRTLRHRARELAKQQAALQERIRVTLRAIAALSGEAVAADLVKVARG
jgi:hypothetical protein